MTVDYGKLFTIAMVLVSVTVLALTGHLSSDAVTAVVFAAVGYTFGNGVQARKGQLPAPLLGPGPASTPPVAGRARSSSPVPNPEPQPASDVDEDAAL